MTLPGELFHPTIKHTSKHAHARVCVCVCFPACAHVSLLRSGGSSHHSGPSVSTVSARCVFFWSVLIDAPSHAPSPDPYRACWLEAAPAAARALQTRRITRKNAAFRTIAVLPEGVPRPLPRLRRSLREVYTCRLSKSEERRGRGGGTSANSGKERGRIKTLHFHARKTQMRHDISKRIPPSRRRHA